MCECEQQLLLQRVMASGLYILMRFFLRVDGVIVRMNDTRIHHQVHPPSSFNTTPSQSGWYKVHNKRVQLKGSKNT